MRSVVRISLILGELFLCGLCFAQTEKIDSLKKVLPALKDTARIDCLSKFAVHYLMSMQKDSSNYYTNIVYEESKKLNYLHGLAEAYMQKAAFANHFHNDFPAMEQMAREALKWFNLTSNKKNID